MRQLWRDAEHLFRLAGLFVVGLFLFLVVRALAVPEGFGRLGHYRAGAIDDNRVPPLVYAGRAACADCHAEAVEAKAAGAHRGIGCESCHGALAAHASDPDSAAAKAPEATPLCLRCHTADQAKPKGFPQVDPAPHAEGAACNDCHQAHAPSVS